MSVRSAPPLPRSGRLMTGGANSLELLWALLALAGIALIVVASAIAWVAVWVEAHLAGTRWDVPVWEMPAVLLDVAASTPPGDLAAAVAAPWRPV